MTPARPPGRGLSPLAAIGTVALVLGVSAVVAMRNSPDPTHPRIRRWYKRLDKPGFTPPDPVFGAVWPVLESGLAFGGYRLLRQPPDPARNAAMGLWLVTTAMVGGWTQLFFGEKQLGASAIASGAMVGTGAAYVAVAARVDRPAAIAAVPFVAWLGFATLLAEQVWQRNAAPSADDVRSIRSRSVAIKAILFDIDGTLVDSNEMHVLAWEEAFAGAGATFERQAIHDQIGKGTDMLVPSLLPDADETDQKKLGDAHAAVFKSRFLDSVQPFPQAHALLARACEGGQKVVLASSAAKAEIDHYLALLDARELVSATTSADDVENTKPAPDIFAAALEKLAPLGPGEVIVVGDTPYDIEAAAKCGIAAVGLRSGKFSDEALLGAGAVALYDDAAALLRDYDSSPLAATIA